MTFTGSLPSLLLAPVKAVLSVAGVDLLVDKFLKVTVQTPDWLQKLLSGFAK